MLNLLYNFLYFLIGSIFKNLNVIISGLRFLRLFFRFSQGVKKYFASIPVGLGFGGNEWRFQTTLRDPRV